MYNMLRYVSFWLVFESVKIPPRAFVQCAVFTVAFLIQKLFRGVLARAIVCSVSPFTKSCHVSENSIYNSYMTSIYQRDAT